MDREYESSLFLNDSQKEKLVENFLRTRHRNKIDASEYEVKELLNWAEKAAMEYALLLLVLDGFFDINLSAGEQITFKLTEKGNQLSDSLLDIVKERFKIIFDGELTKDEE